MEGSQVEMSFEELRALRSVIVDLENQLDSKDRALDLQDAKWYQIHTNGATATFARFYASPDGTGEFEKVSVDFVNGTNEVFGEEHYHDWQDAKTRVRVAIRRGE